MKKKREKPGKRKELSAQESSLNLLPNETLIYCFTFLDPKSLAVLLLVNHRFKTLSEDNLFWKIKVKNFLITTIEKDIFEFYFQEEEINYRQLFYKIFRFRKNYSTVLIDNTDFTSNVLSTTFESSASGTKEEIEFDFFYEREKSLFNAERHVGLLSMILVSGKIKPEIHEAIEKRRESFSRSQTSENVVLRRESLLYSQVITTLIFSQDVSQILKYQKFLDENSSDFSYLSAAAKSGDLIVFKKVLSFYLEEETEQEKGLITRSYGAEFSRGRMYDVHDFGRQAWIAAVETGSRDIIDYYFSDFDHPHENAFSITLKSEENHTSILCYIKDTKTAEKLFSRREIITLIEDENVVKVAYDRAIRKGNNEVIQFFEERFDENKLRMSVNQDALVKGISKGLNVNNTKKFYEIVCHQFNETNVKPKTIDLAGACSKSAVEINNELLLYFFLEECGERRWDIHLGYGKRCYKMATKMGHLDLFKKLLRNFKEHNYNHHEFSFFLFNSLKIAIAHQNEDLANYIIRELKDSGATVDELEAMKFYDNTLQQGNIYFFKLLLEAEIFSVAFFRSLELWLGKTRQYDVVWKFLNLSQITNETYFENYQFILFVNVVKTKIPKFVEEFFQYYQEFSLFKSINNVNQVMSPFLEAIKYSNAEVIRYLIKKV